MGGSSFFKSRRERISTLGKFSQANLRGCFSLRITTELLVACCVILLIEIVEFQWIHDKTSAGALPGTVWQLMMATTGVIFLLILWAYRQQWMIANQLHYRASFEALVSAISTRLIHLDAEAMAGEIDRALCDIGQFMDVDRSYLFFFSEDRKTASCMYEWCRKDVVAQHEMLHDVSCDQFAYALGRTLKGQVIHVPDVGALGPEAQEEKREWLREEIQSLVTVPIFQAGEVVGLVGFDSVRRRRYWTEDTIALLRIVGEMFSNALGRLQSDHELQVRERAMASAANGIVILDAQQPANPVVYVNKAFERISGYGTQEVLGHPSGVLLNILANVSSRETLCQAMQEHRESHLVLEGTRKDGSPFWSELSISPVLNHAGEVTHCIGIQNDITEQKLARETQAKLESQLRQTQKLEAVGTLASGVAHDFNNLITAILGHVEIAQKQLEADHPAGPSLQMIQRVAQQACGVTDSLLMFAKKSPSQKQAVDLCEFVPEIMRLLGRLFPASIELDVRVEPSSPLRVWGNPTEIQQVLMNLTLNARDAMPQGGTLTVRVQATEEIPPQAKIQVSDTGAGMTPQTQSKMFDPFFTTKPRSEGTGLGLSIVHGIVTSLQGKIQVQSEPNQGTTITLTLPPSEVPPESPPEAHGPSSGVSTRGMDTSERALEKQMSGSEKKAAPMYMLVAEDHSFVAEIMATTFEEAGWQVVLCVTGSEVVQKLESHHEPIHMAVLDLDLPGVHGLQCLEHLRQTRGDIPAILISGNPQRFNVVPPIPNTLFLPKPFSMSQLQQAVAQMLKSSRQSEER